MPALAFMGYHWSVILIAAVALYAAYIVIEGVTWATNAMLVVPPSTRRLLRGWWTIPLMPAYRYMVFWMRFAGTLTVLTEARQWRTVDTVSASHDQLQKMLRVLPRRRTKEIRQAA